MKTRPNYIYLDNAATTPVLDCVKEQAIDFIKSYDTFQNPSSSYNSAKKIRNMVEDSRDLIATLIGAKSNEIYFTSGGAEANSWVQKIGHVVCSNIEHSSLATSPLFGVNKNGIVNIDILKYVLDMIDGVGSFYNPYNIVSTMYVNNEIGTIQPIKEIASVAHKHNKFFHTDAVQAVGHLPIDVKKLNCDLLSASAHKFGGFKGIGFLYVKESVPMRSLIFGGSQEKGLRGGTENVLGIITMAKALEYSVKHMNSNNAKIVGFQKQILQSLLSIDGVELNGDLNNRINSNVNVRIKGITGSNLVSMLDIYNICVSTGSACHEGEAVPSKVLKNIGLTDEEALSSVRITIGINNTQEEIDEVCKLIPTVIKRLRIISKGE